MSLFLITINTTLRLAVQQYHSHFFACSVEAFELCIFQVFSIRSLRDWLGLENTKVEYLSDVPLSFCLFLKRELRAQQFISFFWLKNLWLQIRREVSRVLLSASVFFGGTFAGFSSSCDFLDSWLTWVDFFVWGAVKLSILGWCLLW